MMETLPSRFADFTLLASLPQQDPAGPGTLPDGAGASAELHGASAARWEKTERRAPSRGKSGRLLVICGRLEEGRRGAGRSWAPYGGERFVISRKKTGAGASGVETGVVHGPQAPGGHKNHVHLSRWNPLNRIPTLSGCGRRRRQEIPSHPGKMTERALGEHK